MQKFTELSAAVNELLYSQKEKQRRC